MPVQKLSDAAWTCSKSFFSAVWQISQMKFNSKLKSHTEIRLRASRLAGPSREAPGRGWGRRKGKPNCPELKCRRRPCFPTTEQRPAEAAAPAEAAGALGAGAAGRISGGPAPPPPPCLGRAPHYLPALGTASTDTRARPSPAPSSRSSPSRLQAPPAGVSPLGLGC